MALFVPNGLPQAMQGKGSSSFTTLCPPLHASKSMRGSSVMTFSGHVAWQSPHCTHMLSEKRSIGISGLSDSAPVGQAATQEWHSVQPSTFTLTPPKGAPLSSAITGTGAGAAACNSRNIVSSTPRLAPRATMPAGFGEATPSGAATSCARKSSGSSVWMMDDDSCAEAEPGDDLRAGVDHLLRAGDVVLRLAAREQRRARAAVGEHGGDGLGADLRHFVDAHGEDVRRQAVAEARQRVDQRFAVVTVVEQHERVDARPPCA